MIFFSVCRVFFADCVYICVRQCWEDGCFQILCFSDCQRYDVWLFCEGARDDVGTRSDLKFFPIVCQGYFFPEFFSHLSLVLLCVRMMRYGGGAFYDFVLWKRLSNRS